MRTLKAVMTVISIAFGTMRSHIFMQKVLRRHTEKNLNNTKQPMRSRKGMPIRSIQSSSVSQRPAKVTIPVNPWDKEKPNA